MDERAGAEVDLATRSLVGLIERHMPAMLESLTLVGSAVDGDYRAGQSDLDFVAVLKAPPTEDDIDGLTVLHRLYGSDPTLPALGGIWITPDQIAAGPDAVGLGPTSDQGTFLESAMGNRNPVTWITLREMGSTILGTLDRDAVWHDHARLMTWVRANVDEYWYRRWLADSHKLFTARGVALLRKGGVAWGVLGISRMHFTLATGGIASKSQAGDHARQTFDPRWHRIIDEALRIRRGNGRPLYGNLFARRREALAFVAMVIDSIRRDHSP
jgi:hypothetical protein